MMKIILIIGNLLFYFLCNSFASPKRDQPMKLRYKTMLGHTGVMAQLSWDIETATETIKFRLEVETDRASLIGFGFSDRGETENADWVVISTTDDNTHRFQVSL